MNPTELHHRLDQAAERGTVRGADDVFDASRHALPSQPDRTRLNGRSRRWTVIAAAAAVLVLITVVAGVVRHEPDPQRVETTPTTTDTGHRIRVSYRSTEVRPADPTGTAAASNDLTDDLDRTVHARLVNYLGHETSVEPDGDSVIATVPTSISPTTLTSLLDPIGRLAVDQLDGPADTTDCGTGPLSSTVAERGGTWPAWASVRACYSYSTSSPTTLAWTGRGLTVTPAPDGKVEIQTIDDHTANVSITVPPPNFTGSSRCDAGSRCVEGGALHAWVVALDNVAITPVSAAAPTNATITGLTPSDAQVLRAVLLAPAFFNPVTFTDLDASTPPTSTTTVPADLVATDIVAIKAAMAEFNDGWAKGTSAGFDAKAATAWPPGQVTRANVVCGFAAAQSAGSIPPSLDQAETNLINSGASEHLELANDNSVQATPGWTIPTGFLRPGQVPDGRIYLLAAHLTQGGGSPLNVDLHVTVINDHAYFFPQLC